MLGLDPVDLQLHRQVLVAGVGDVSPDRLADGKGALQRDAEPGAELAGVGERTPDARSRRAEQDLLLDVVCARGVHEQPPGC